MYVRIDGDEMSDSYDCDPIRMAPMETAPPPPAPKTKAVRKSRAKPKEDKLKPQLAAITKPEPPRRPTVAKDPLKTFVTALRAFNPDPANYTNAEDVPHGFWRAIRNLQNLLAGGGNDPQTLVAEKKTLSRSMIIVVDGGNIKRVRGPAMDKFNEALNSI